MFKYILSIAKKLWSWFRQQSLFIQLLLIIPIACSIALTVLVGNMGLALMGTAIALSAPIVGLVGGFFSVVLAKAGIVIAKDRRKPK